MKKEQRNLILVFIVLILIWVIIIWWGFFKNKAPVPNEVVPNGVVIDEVVPHKEVPKKIRINFEVLRLPILEKLEPFPEIEPFEQEIGRKNPFVEI